MKMKRLWFLSIIVFILITVSKKYSWICVYDLEGIYDEIGYSVRQTEDKGYIVVGAGIPFSSDNFCYDLFLVKTDSLGNMEWSKVYGGEGNDKGLCVRETSDGSFIITGFLGGPDTWRPGDLWLLKTDAEGELVWGRAYGNNWEDEGRWVEQTSDGKYIISGSWNPTGGIDRRCWLLKADENGDTLWTKTYLFTSHGYCVKEDADGYILAAPYGLIKTDLDGDTVWTFRFVGRHSACDVADDGYILTSTAWGPAGIEDVFLIKTNKSGDSLWARSKGGADEDESYDVQQTTDGGYIVVGETWSFGSGHIDAWLLKTDANGDTLWTRTIGGVKMDRAYSVQQTTDGGYIITGTTWSFGGDGLLWLIKTDSLGYVGIEEHPVAYRSDWEVISSIGRHITLSYSDRPEGFRASIYDATGRRIDEIQSTGQSGTLTWPVTPGEGMLSGVYFVREESEHNPTTRKVILIR